MLKILATGAFVVLAFASPASAAGDPIFSVSGSFLAGEATSFYLYDACSVPETEGVNSNCRAVDPAAHGENFTFQGYDLTGTAIFGICFWSEEGVDLACFCATSEPATDATCVNRMYQVPDGAAKLSVFALNGALLSWTIEVHEEN